MSVSHADASLEQLESVSLACERETLEQLYGTAGVSEAFVLQTCNRVEAYVVTADPADGRTALEPLTEAVPDTVVRKMGHEASLRHLLRVAGGLESLVLGEDQILGQVRDACEQAAAAGAAGPVLEQALTKAIRVGERARTETEINEGVVSLASAAVKLVEEKHGLDGTSAAVVGTGEMGTLATKRLAGRVEDLVLVNRTVDRARKLANRVDTSETAVETAGLDGLAQTLQARDVVISATGSAEPILDTEECKRLGETFIVDITRPRDVPKAADSLSHLTVYDLDKLEAVTEKTRQMRREAASQVEDIVTEELERLMRQYKRTRADTVISAMYESAERIKADELETAFHRESFDESERETIEAMANSIVSQLLAPPTNSLRDAAEADDWSTIHTALQLFDPHLEDEQAREVLSKLDFDNIPEDVRDGLPASGFDESDD